MHWLFLYIAITFEVCGTILMKLSEGFTKMTFAIPMLILYVLSLVLLSQALKTIEVGISYAIWSGVGMALIAIIGIVYFHETVTVNKLVFLAMIFIGTIGLSLSGAGH